MIDTEGAERPARLVNQLLPVDEDDDAVALGAGALGDVGKEHGLARAGRADDERRPLAGSVGASHAIDEVELVVSELNHVWSPFTAAMEFFAIAAIA